MFYFWAKLTEILGLWALSKSAFAKSLVVATVVMLTYVSSAFLVRELRKKHYFCSKDNPVDKSGLVMAMIICGVIVVSSVCFLAR